MIRALVGVGFLILAFHGALNYESELVSQSVVSLSGAVTIAAGCGFWFLLPFLQKISSRFSKEE